MENKPKPITKITQLHAVDFKRIVEVDITPSDRQSLVLITGPNANGKTSAIDALKTALAGGRHEPAQPTRTGQTQSRIEVTLQDEHGTTYHVQYRNTRGKSYIQVTSENTTTPRHKISKPRTTLSGLLNTAMLDPLKFDRDTPTKRLHTFLTGYGLAERHEQIQKERRHHLDQLDSAKKDGMRLNKTLQDTPDPAPDTKLQEPDTTQLTETLRNQHNHNAVIQVLNNGIAAIDDQRPHLVQTIRRLEQELHDAKTRLQNADQSREETARKLQDAGPLKDTRATSDALQQACRTADLYRKQQAHRRLRSELNEATKLYDGSREAIRENDQKLKDLVSQTDVSSQVPGFSYDGEDFTVNGLPYQQASGKERTTISTMIAMATNPPLRDILVDEANDLDADALDALAKIASERGYRVWMTSVWAQPHDNDAILTVPIAQGRTTKPIAEAAAADDKPASDEQPTLDFDL